MPLDHDQARGVLDGILRDQTRSSMTGWSAPNLDDWVSRLEECVVPSDGITLTRDEAAWLAYWLRIPWGSREEEARSEALAVRLERELSA